VWLADRRVRPLLAIRARYLATIAGEHDPGKAESVTQALLKMKKIDIKTLEQAYQQG
jgi:hypothetical protein